MVVTGSYPSRLRIKDFCANEVLYCQKDNFKIYKLLFLLLLTFWEIIFFASFSPGFRGWGGMLRVLDMRLQQRRPTRADTGPSTRGATSEWSFISVQWVYGDVGIHWTTGLQDYRKFARPKTTPEDPQRIHHIQDLVAKKGIRAIRLQRIPEEFCRL